MRRFHDIPEKSTLQFLLNAFLGAYNRRTDVIARQASGGDAQKLDAIIDMQAQFGIRLGLLETRAENTHGLIFELNGKVEKMSTNLDRIEKEAADAAENVSLVRTAVEELKTTSAAMQAEITALTEQVAKGQLDQARLDAAAAVFEKADDDIDAIVLPATPPNPEG